MMDAICRFLRNRFRPIIAVPAVSCSAICKTAALQLTIAFMRVTPVHMVNTRPDGTYVQERTMTYSTRVVKKESGYEKFDFHSLRNSK